MNLLENGYIYNEGKMVGPLQLEEGEKAGPFLLIENSGTLSAVDPTKEELKETRLNGKKEKYLLALEGRAQMADMVNANNRIYPEAIWKKMFENKDLLKSIDNGEMLMECDHPIDGETRLNRVVGKVTKLWRNPNNMKEVMGRFVVFDNEIGRNIKAIHDGGGRLGVSSRGQGSVVRLNGKDVVQEDFKPQTWDIVHGPSTPGAYPEEVTESTTATSPKENKRMTRLEELASRFQKIRDRDITKLSADAVGIIKEQVEDIQVNLTEENFRDESPRAAKLVTEATNFLRDLPEKGMPPSDYYDKKGKTPWGSEPDKHNIPDQEETVDLDAKLDADWNASWIGKKYANNKVLKAAFTAGWHGQKHSDAGSGKPTGIAYSLGKEFKKGTRKENLSRPDNVQGVTETVQLLDVEPTKDIHEALKSCRSEYRDAVGVEGPLDRHEVSGLNEAAKILVDFSTKLEESCPIIKAWVGNDLMECASYFFECTSEAELRTEIKKILEKDGGPLVINIDRSEAVYAECAKRFSGLLEAQTVKAEKAIREKADTESSISELSAKLFGAKKLIEGFAIKCKRLEEENKVLLSERDAACKILDEMPKEVQYEGIRGAVSVVAAISPNDNGLNESLSAVGSVQDVVSIAKSLSKRSLPKIDREPTHPELVDEAIETNENLQESIRNKNKERVDSRTRHDQALSKKVIEEMRKRGGK